LFIILRSALLIIKNERVFNFF
ncbi:hypothetical protein CABS01_12969, partial [Colletotrichum abscissum]